MPGVRERMWHRKERLAERSRPGSEGILLPSLVTSCSKYVPSFLQERRFSKARDEEMVPHPYYLARNSSTARLNSVGFSSVSQ